MEHKLGRIPALMITGASAAAAFFLRQHQLTHGYEIALDGVRRVIPGTGTGFFTWFSVIAVLLFAVYAFFLKKRKKYAALGHTNLPELLLSLLAALALLLGSCATLVADVTALERIIGVAGLVAAVCWVGTAVFQYRGQKPSVVLYMLPALFFAAMLVVEFRVWSRDPAVLDYCYDLFALICVMCGLFHLGGFSLEQGGRRITVFFHLCGLFFCAASLAGSAPRHMLTIGGAMLWMAVNLWRLLRPGKKHTEPEDV